jgi:predicted NBD/HSP70 family sugar kinase
MMDTVLAVDLGGTKLLIGEVDKDGKILRSKKYNSGFLDQKQALQLIISSLEDYIQSIGFDFGKPLSLGLGLIGQVLPEEGTWVMIDPKRIDPTPIVKVLSELFKMNCYIENDVKAATLAEQRFGAGKNTRDFVYLNIGTGIAAGFISQGQLIRGWQNDAGEIGHTTVDYKNNIPCVCGRFGCVEAIASGSGMNQRVKQLITRYTDSPLYHEAKKGFVHAEDIFKYAELGDVLAQRVAQDAVDAAAELILNIIQIFNPKKIILGGGVGGSEWMQAELPKRLKLYCMSSVSEGIVISQLNPNTTGLIGAATIALAGSWPAP